MNPYQRHAFAKQRREAKEQLRAVAAGAGPKRLFGRCEFCGRVHQWPEWRSEGRCWGKRETTSDGGTDGEPQLPRA